MAIGPILSGLKRTAAEFRRRLSPGTESSRFRGSFKSHAEAIASVRPGSLAGYNHSDIADVSFDKMCQRELWDYPVMYWLERLLPLTNCIVDAGGHMGTKYRAFRSHLRLPENFEWAVYDMPAIARAGRDRAQREGLTGLSFFDRLEDTPPTDVLLASGLLQYLDIELSELLRKLPAMPKHLILNKVATRDEAAIFTLEDFGTAEVPYQVRNLSEFLQSMADLGYDIEDTWNIPSLSHVHAAFGRSISRGFYARLKGQIA